MSDSTTSPKAASPGSGDVRSPLEVSPPLREDHVVRFTNWARFQHAAMMLLFLALLVTGLPQKWPAFEAGQWTVEVLGGIYATRWWHRVAGLLFGVLMVAHLVWAVVQLLRGRIRPTMFLSRRDFTDAVQSVRYDLGRAEERPRFGRYDYRQKFEYWGLIFGSFIMVSTGLILQVPILTARWLPAELIPAAKAAHSNEALLALSIILVWHLYGAHLNPDVFPFDTSIFTGRISKSRLRHEHALEYEELFGAADEVAPAEDAAPTSERESAEDREASPRA